jgi:hypothetical protein
MKWSADTEKTLEAKIAKKILDYINAMPNGYAIKVVGSVYSMGNPDIVGCIGSRAVVIEVKRPGELPTLNQCAHLRKWDKAGALAFWTDSVVDAMTYLKENLI